MSNRLMFAQLRSAVSGDAVAIRYVADLQPADGLGGKIFPSTYKDGRYHIEKRRRDGREVEAVVLDSVQSQANRLELALLGAWREERLKIPMLAVSFAAEGLADIGEITVLEAPHRLADAIFRDSKLKGQLFSETAYAKALVTATPQNATALFRVCPTGLLFGVWDSTGEMGGLGTKFQRNIVSEIVAYDVTVGHRTASRIDPLRIEKVPIYKRKDDATGELPWTAIEDHAEKDEKGNAIRYARKEKSKSKGKPSEIIHGNVTPDLVRDEKTRQPLPGGVTFEYARHTAVITLAGLRKLRFPLSNGTANADETARSVLAALAVVALCEQERAGYDLRSRCLLVPDGEPRWEFVNPRGETSPFAVTREEAMKIFDEASAKLPSDLGWRPEKVVFNPTQSLIELVKESRKHGGVGEVDEEAE